MKTLDRAAVQRALLGRKRARRAVAGAALGLVALASVAFLFGADVGLYGFWGWYIAVPALGAAAGLVGAGAVTGVASVWLVLLWGYVFPPLVGYVTGAWMEGGGRYHHPRMAGYAYVSARDELLGGVDAATGGGLVAALVVGLLGYCIGVAGWRAATRLRA